MGFMLTCYLQDVIAFEVSYLKKKKNICPIENFASHQLRLLKHLVTEGEGQDAEERTS